MELTTLITTLSILLIINILGIIYSYLIVNNKILYSIKLQTRPHKIENFYSRVPLIIFNLFILVTVTGLGLYFFSSLGLSILSAIFDETMPGANALTLIL